MAGGSARERCGGIGPGPAAAAALRRPGRRCTLEAHWRARGRGGSPTRVGTYFIVGLFFGIARLVILNEIVPQQLPWVGWSRRLCCSRLAGGAVSTECRRRRPAATPTSQPALLPLCLSPASVAARRRDSEQCEFCPLSPDRVVLSLLCLYLSSSSCNGKQAAYRNTEGAR